MFPALNPALSPEDGNLLSGQSLLAAYIATMQVCFLQIQYRLLSAKAACLVSLPVHAFTMVMHIPVMLISRKSYIPICTACHQHSVYHQDTSYHSDITHHI